MLWLPLGTAIEIQSLFMFSLLAEEALFGFSSAEGRHKNILEMERYIPEVSGLENILNAIGIRIFQIHYSLSKVLTVDVDYNKT